MHGAMQLQHFFKKLAACQEAHWSSYQLPVLDIYLLQWLANPVGQIHFTLPGCQCEGLRLHYEPEQRWCFYPNFQSANCIQLCSLFIFSGFIFSLIALPCRLMSRSCLCMHASQHPFGRSTDLSTFNSLCSCSRRTSASQVAFWFLNGMI